MLILEWWKSNNDDFQIKGKSGFLEDDFLGIMVKNETYNVEKWKTYNGA